MIKKIVIIFLGDFYFDARCINMADTIIDSGLELSIIDTGKSGSKYRGHSIHHINVADRGIFKFFKFHLRAKNILNKINPKIIIAADLYSLPAATSNKNSFIVYDSRELYTKLAGLKSQPIKQLYWSYIEKKNINKANTVLVTAPGDGNFLRKTYNDLKLSTIYNFPSLKMIPSGKNSLRKKLNLTLENPIFLYQGVLHKDRGIKKMINLLEYFSNAHAVIIGNGPYNYELKDYSKSVGLSNRTHFYGAVQYLDLLEVTADANIGFSLINPISKSYEQALPNKLFEYAIAGIPVIASKLPEIEKIINKYNIGYSVPHNDLEGQILAVTKILKEFNKLEIKKIAEKNFVWENQQQLFLKSLGNNG